MKEYIDIKLDQHHHSPSELTEVKPEDIIFLVHYIDRGHDHASEDWETICQIAYYQGEEIVRREFIRATKEVKELLQRAGDKLTKMKDGEGDTGFIGRPHTDFYVVGNTLTYQDKYRFDKDGYESGALYSLLFFPLMVKASREHDLELYRRVSTDEEYAREVEHVRKYGYLSGDANERLGNLQWQVWSNV